VCYKPLPMNQPVPVTPPARILVVDDDAAVREVLAAILADEGYEVATATGAAAALDRVAAGDVDLVLSDLKMPGHDGLWLLDRLREDHPTTAVILLTGYGDTDVAVDCLRRGAHDFLQKPPRLPELVRSIERALGRRAVELARQRYQTSLERRVVEKTAELSRALLEVEHAYAHTLFALVAALDAREHETGDHSQRVARYALAIALRLGVADEELAAVSRGALLHDIGKIGIPDAILLKPGRLTPGEWEEMRRHPEVGFGILKGIDFLRGPAEIVLSHHERWDGAGYPRGLAGEAIPLGARIFAVADTLDAMTADRPYRKGTDFAAAREEIVRQAGKQFDPAVVEAFASLSDETLAELRWKPLDEVGGAVAARFRKLA
jgi:putative nucleotidyltransferase with HDIG domain